MKKHIAALVPVIVLFSGAVQAQPAGKPNMAAIMKGGHFGSGTTCKIIGKDNIVKERVIGGYEWRYSVPIECRTTEKIAGFPQAKRLFDGSANFSSLGGPWTWSRFNPWDRWLEGMPKPDVNALKQAIDADKSAVVRSAFLNEITAFHVYGIQPKARVLWNEPTTLKTNVEIVADFKQPGQELVKKKMVFEVLFKREGTGGPWQVASSKTRPEDEQELERRKVPNDEWRALLPVMVKEAEKAAETRLATLPKVEVPPLDTARDAQRLVYKVLRESSREELEAWLRALYAGSRRMQGSTVLLNADTEKELNDVLDKTFGANTTFKEQYCSNPMPKADNDYGFENKDRSAWSGIRVVAEGGTFQDGKEVGKQWRVSELKLSLAQGKPLERLRSWSTDLCAVSLPKASGGTWQTGDRVEAKRYNDWVKGELVEIKDQKALIKYDMGSKDWHKPTELREPGAPAAADATDKSTEPAADAPSFAVGDRVEGNYNGKGRWYKGTIKDFNSEKDKARVHYDDGTSEWLTFDRIRRL